MSDIIVESYDFKIAYFFPVLEIKSFSYLSKNRENKLVYD